jgi:catechol 2,3-dioxygenase-like lactoylglutathione lyase family enzyme
MVRGIKFVGIPVRDQDVSLKFYTEALGLKVATDQPFTDMQRWIELLIPGAETGLALYTPKVTRGASASFSPLPSGVTTCSQPPKC